LHIFIRMRKEIIQSITIPEGIEAKIDKNLIFIKGPEGENKKEFNTNGLIFEKKENEVVIGNENSTKKEKKRINTIASHIKNMILGVQKKYEYKLKICFNHFPITLDIQKDKILVKNFLGEKMPRKLKLLSNVEVELNKDIVSIRSCDKELAGQTAANFENATRIRKRDRRVFQDGIFIISKEKTEE